jgi:hypothetical protein
MRSYFTIYVFQVIIKSSWKYTEDVDNYRKLKTGLQRFCHSLENSANVAGQ